MRSTDGPSEPQSTFRQERHASAKVAGLAENPRKRKLERSPRSKHREHKRKKTVSRDDGSRRWVFSPRDRSTYSDRFVIVSYNILGVENALNHPELYDKIEPRYLRWDRRKLTICRELRRYNPGILCFQEVDCFNDLAEHLCKDGYVGFYKGRTGEANDGCAIFWRKKQFTLLYQESIEFQKFGLRNNVAQLCVIKMHKNHSYAPTSKKAGHSVEVMPFDRAFVVGNIHVLFNPNRGDIKLGQIRLLLEKAYGISKEWGNIPVVIAGDLNSVPQSALYQFLASSELEILMHDRKKISGQIECSYRNKALGAQGKNKRDLVSMSNFVNSRWSEEEILLASGSKGCTRLQHFLNLCSAYPGIPGNNRTRDDFGEPLATSYHSMFMGTVDYIWHSSELAPVGVVETLPLNTLRRIGGLPSEKWGSDHLALVSELAFLDDSNLPNGVFVS